MQTDVRGFGYWQPTIKACAALRHTLMRAMSMVELKRFNLGQSGLESACATGQTGLSLVLTVVNGIVFYELQPVWIWGPWVVRHITLVNDYNDVPFSCRLQ